MAVEEQLAVETSAADARPADPRRRAAAAQVRTRHSSSGASLAWELLTFAFATLRAIFTPPYSWGGEFIDQAWILLKRASIPAAASAFGFGYGAPGLQGTSLVEPFGDINRVAAILGAATIREQAVWVTGMVVAGRDRHRDLRRPRCAQGPRRAQRPVGDGRRRDAPDGRAARARDHGADAGDGAAGDLRRVLRDRARLPALRRPAAARSRRRRPTATPRSTSTSSSSRRSSSASSSGSSAASRA